jgi:DNA-binding LacI/PurR family transcriptional regulator
MSITLQEIANKANCSKTTVSLVLNGRKNHNISEELCEKINSIAKNNNYKKKNNTSRIVAIIYPKSMRQNSSPYYSGILKGISNFLNEKAFAPTSVYHNESENEDWFLENPVLCKSAGIVLCEPPSAALLEFLEDVETPVVTLNFKLPGYPLVSSDIFGPTMEAMTHLKNRGVKKIGFIGGNEHPIYLQRYQHFLSGALYNNIRFDEKYLIRTSPDTRESYNSVMAFLEKSKGSMPDAFVCSSEGIAGSAMKALQDSGISIPKDIGLLSFGYGDYPFPFVPSLSMIQVLNEKEGLLLGKIIIDLIENKSAFTDWNCLVPGEFIIGESS